MSHNTRPRELSTNDSEAALIPTPNDDLTLSHTSHTEHNEYCGLSWCKPKCIQSLANVKLFTALTCILACMNGSISASYLPSVITTIERRFEFGSSVTGLIVASYEIGATVAVIFVSYLGNQRNIPVIMGWGTLLVGTGTCLFALPHFITAPYSLILSGELNITTDDMCLNSVANDNGIDHQGSCATENFQSSGNGIYVVIFVLAQSFIGIGSTPILTLGLSYIDNHVPKKKSPQYLAFVYAAATLGPVLGFGCGAALMEVYVDFMTPSVIKLPITSTDSKWVGAWWVGFLIFGVMNIVIAPPFFLFPKHLHTQGKTRCANYIASAEGDGHRVSEICGEELEERASVTAQISAETKCSTIREFPKAVVKLLKNPVYMLLNLTSVFEMVIVTGFITFVPKYLETQFDLRTSEANLYTGSLAIPGAALGIISSGMVLKKLKLTNRGTVQFSVILSVLSLAVFSLAFLFGCDNLQIAGITVPYHKSADRLSRVSLLDPNLTSLCNSDCTCQQAVYSPVCGSNSLTYFSACHAGCRLSINGTFKDCGCVQNPLTSTVPVTQSTDGSEGTLVESMAGHISVGACKRDCHMLIPFMFFLFTICFLMAGLKTPITAVTMRCVGDELRSFSLGIQMVIVRTCALLPAPIIFGSIIDTTCLWWKYDCESRKNCLLYDSESYRYKYGGICTGMHIMGLLTFVLTWCIVRRQENMERTAQTGVQTIKTVDARARFYMNDEGECSVPSLAPTESTNAR